MDSASLSVQVLEIRTSPSVMGSIITGAANTLSSRTIASFFRTFFAVMDANVAAAFALNLMLIVGWPPVVNVFSIYWWYWFGLRIKFSHEDLRLGEEWLVRRNKSLFN
jgi:hypothetical protein